MFKLLESIRTPEKLILHLKYDIRCGRSFVWLFIAFICLVYFFSLGGGDNLLFGLGTLFCIFFGLFSVLRFVRSFFLHRVITFDAGTLKLEEYLDFGNGRWSSHKIFDRAKLPKPNRFIVRTGEDNQNVLPRDEGSLRYETRIAHRERGSGGTVIVHKSEKIMERLQELVDVFWNEVPYDPGIKAFDEAEVRRLPRFFSKNPRGDEERVPHDPDEREKKIRNEKIDRNDSGFDREERGFDRGEEKSRRKKRAKIFFPRIGKGVVPGDEKSMVSAELELNEQRAGKTLSLLSVRGGRASTVLANISSWTYKIVSALVFVVSVALFMLYICNRDEATERIFDFYENRILSDFVPENGQEFFLEVMREYRGIDPRERLYLDPILLGTFLLLVPHFLLYFPFLILRWPFWRCWLVRLEYYRTAHCKIVSSTWNDRFRKDFSKISYGKFFRAVPAGPKTNRLLTGRTIFSFLNPAWKMPCQVVIVSEEGSVPIPCSGKEEQERIIRMLESFVLDARRQSGVFFKELEDKFESITEPLPGEIVRYSIAPRTVRLDESPQKLSPPRGCRYLLRKNDHGIEFENRGVFSPEYSFVYMLVLGFLIAFGGVSVWYFPRLMHIENSLNPGHVILFVFLFVSQVVFIGVILSALGLLGKLFEPFRRTRLIFTGEKAAVRISWFGVPGEQTYSLSEWGGLQIRYDKHPEGTRISRDGDDTMRWSLLVMRTADRELFRIEKLTEEEANWMLDTLLSNHAIIRPRK